MHPLMTGMTERYPKEEVVAFAASRVMRFGGWSFAFPAPRLGLKGAIIVLL